jgi:hypothetical protein
MMRKGCRLQTHNTQSFQKLHLISQATQGRLLKRERSAHTKKPRPASGFYGVYAQGKRWQASVYYDSKKCYLGCFGTKQEAALAYDREARQCGKGKPLNYESTAAAGEAAAAAATSA